LNRNKILIADIGGTNARFALASKKKSGFEDARSYQSDEFESIDEAIRHYLESVDALKPAMMCLGAAGPVSGRSIKLTNGPWVIDADNLSRQFGNCAVFLLNDFDAAAWSIPLLQFDDCTPIGGPPPNPLDGDSYTVGIVGPGTGLGTAGFYKSGDHYQSIGGEAGISGFSAETAEQAEISMVLRERLDRVAAEHLLSGRGLENIYWALSRIHGEECAPLSAAEIGLRGHDGSDALAAKTMRVFFEVLGQYAGDIALVLGADDGIFIAGGIAKRYPELLINSPFRDGFENKAPHQELMKRIPTLLITHDEPGLLGASNYARQLTTR
jgi:glucokinase